MPIYEISSVSGPDHAKEFTAGVYMDGKCLGSGSGRTKKDAEEHAAEVALKMLEVGELEERLKALEVTVGPKKSRLQ